MNENKDDYLFKYFKFNKFCFILKYQSVKVINLPTIFLFLSMKQTIEAIIYFPTKIWYIQV
jgi:hypothetical protein